MSSPIKLIATDLDGTLLNSLGKISERNMEVLTKAARLGVSIIINTGRMFASAKDFASQLGFHMPLICYNGAMLRGPNGEILSHLTLDMDIARQLLSMFRERGMYVQSYIDDVLFVKDQNEDEAQDYMRFFGVKLHPIGDDIYSPQSAPTKLLSVTDGLEQSHELKEELSRLFGTKLYVTSSNSNFVEMMNPGVNKGRGLTAMANMLTIPMEAVMAIGDGENDIEMLRLSGIGVAMQNAREIVKETANYIAPTNDEDGVAWAIEKFVLS
ncbi:MAG: Cof-type HAD-IIB family hydrolase [Synergistaceae bacterium]|nr:Cof-type HAD-IIB family hydrolase [Synergistaceae bacterium]